MLKLRLSFAKRRQGGKRSLQPVLITVIKHFVRKMYKSRGKISACSPPKARANDPATASKNQPPPDNKRRQRQPKKLQNPGGEHLLRKSARRQVQPQNNIAGQPRNQLFQSRHPWKSPMTRPPASHIHTGPNVVIRVAPPRKTGSGRRSNYRLVSRLPASKQRLSNHLLDRLRNKRPGSGC